MSGQFLTNQSTETFNALEDYCANMASSAVTEISLSWAVREPGEFLATVAAFHKRYPAASWTLSVSIRWRTLTLKAVRKDRQP